MNRMNTFFRPLTLLVVLGLAGQVQAHEPMAHDCEAPLRPVDEHDDPLWQAFLNEIDAFRACIEAAKVHHEGAVLRHQQAAKDAVEAWNGFVRTSLNAPEDFPWPPK